MIEKNTITNNSAVSRGDGRGGGIYCYGSSPTIKDNTITGNSAKYAGGGIFCGGDSSPTIEGNTVTANKNEGIYCGSHSSPTINYNNIQGNTNYGVYSSGNVVNAENNWWGDPSGPSGDGPGSGDAVSDYVDFAPWLKEPFTVAIVLTSPNGGESWEGGSTHYITWSTIGNRIDHIKLLYSTDSGKSYPNIIVSNATGSYIWKVPNISSNTVRVKVQAVDVSGNILAEDESGRNFTIVVAVPDIKLSATSHNSGTVQVGSYADWTFVISNEGTATLTVNKISSDNPIFTIPSPTFPQNVSPEGSLSVKVRFTPTQANQYSGILTVSSNDPDEPILSVSLIGTGIPAPKPDIQLSDSSQNFGTVLVGSYAKWNLVISNVGNAALTVNSITSDSPAFTIPSPNFPQNISANGKLNVVVRFSPTEEKSYTGTLTIASNDPDEPEVYVSVEGEGRVENKPPVADAGTDQSVSSGHLVRLDGSDSYDSDGTIVSYQWDFGDGQTATGAIVSHRFRGAMNQSKTYTVTLTVEDNVGDADTDSVYITVVPLEKTVEVTHQPAIPVPNKLVFARMTVSYNWIYEDTYVISKIHYESEGFWGVGVISIWDLHSHGIPVPVWTADVPYFWDEKTYYPKLSQILYGGDTFEGIEVDAFDAMNVYIIGWAGISISIGPSLPAPFFVTNSACFQPDFTGVPDLPMEAPDSDLAHLCSPGELRVYDSQGRITGLVNGETKEEIPHSWYYNGAVIVLSPSNFYRYEVVGTDEGKYGLTVASVKDGETTTFTATDIPTAPSAVHQYAIDWDALSKGEEGVTLQIDSDGDGTFEQTVATGNTLTPVGTTPPTDGALKSKNTYAYPNPFNPEVESATLRFSLSKSANVTVKLYDAGGRLVTTLTEDEYMEAKEEQNLPWDGKNDKGDIVANGVYFCVITTDQGERAVCKVAVLR